MRFGPFIVKNQGTMLKCLSVNNIIKCNRISLWSYILIFLNDGLTINTVKCCNACSVLQRAVQLSLQGQIYKHNLLNVLTSVWEPCRNITDVQTLKVRVLSGIHICVIIPNDSFRITLVKS